MGRSGLRYGNARGSVAPSSSADVGIYVVAAAAVDTEQPLEERDGAEDGTSGSESDSDAGGGVVGGRSGDVTPESSVSE